MKEVNTQGITYIEPLTGCGEWYWGTDYIHGDLYEAEELFRDGHPISQNKLLFVHDPDGRVVQPVVAQEGQYLGNPVYDNGRIAVLMVDFPAGQIFWVRRGDKLYFSAWEEDPEYREEVIARKLETGEIIDRFPGSNMTMPDGRLWVLT